MEAEMDGVRIRNSHSHSHGHKRADHPGEKDTDEVVTGGGEGYQNMDDDEDWGPRSNLLDSYRTRRAWVRS